MSMEERCDGTADCQDGMDEENCKAFVTFTGYNKILVPVTNGNGTKLGLNISITIDDILEIDENVGNFKSKYTIFRSWYITHLTFKDLKRNPY